MISFPVIPIAFGLAAIAAVALVFLVRAKELKVLLVVGMLVLALLAVDLWNYHLIRGRQAAVRAEFNPGMTVDQMVSHLEQNRTRLHVSDWRYDDRANWDEKYKQGQGTFFVFLETPFSISAFLREYESAGYLFAAVDLKTSTLLEAFR